MLTSFALRNFRCFEEQKILPLPGWNFFLGPNAVGKTSLLEAICVLLRLQSPRSSTLARCLRFGAEAFHLHGVVGEQKLQLDWQEGGRKLRIDDVAQSRSDFYLGTGRITWFGNEDMELIRGGGAGRRRFLDFIGSQLVPGYAQAVRAYDRALRSRNFLLREGRSRREVIAYDEPLLQHGGSLWRGRGQFFRELTQEILRAAGEIGAARENWSLAWVPEPDSASESFAEELRASESEEWRLRQTVVGPHRDDFRLLLHGQAAADFASEGQQRTLALALKLAQARLLAHKREDAPILLLDDIFGELDQQRRNRLFTALPAASQKFVTTTFLDWAEIPRDGAVIELGI